MTGEVAQPAGRAAAPTEGLGGGDPTLDPANDEDRSSLDLEGEATEGQNPQINGRPVHPEPTKRDTGWGAQYGDCHGIPAFKNVVQDATERATIAAAHTGGLAGDNEFGLTVPFGGALAYQCVEFVSRYYRDALGHGGLGGGNAKTFLQGPRGGLEVHRFPTPTRPQAGDLVVEEGGPSPVGHVGIVESVAGADGGASTVNVVQQNRGLNSPASSFTVTPRITHREVAPGIFRNEVVYEQDRYWAGFRRKEGTAPVDARGGTARSVWLGAPQHGDGNYFVPAGSSVDLDTVARIYGTTVEQLRQFNPCMGNWVTAPASGSVEILVTDSFQHPAPVIGQATITGSSAVVRSAPDRAAASITELPYGARVMVYQVIADGGAVPSYDSREWYKVACYTGQDAYVFKPLCSELS